MRRYDAEDILRRHVVERHLRAAVRAQDISGDLDSTPRMSSDQWVDSCGAVRGVPAATLGLLHVLYCEHAGTEVQTAIVELADGQEIEVEQRVVAKRPTIAQAAQRCGMSTVEARRRVSEACERVRDNLFARAGREENHGY